MRAQLLWHNVVEEGQLIGARAPLNGASTDQPAIVFAGRVNKDYGVAMRGDWLVGEYLRVRVLLPTSQRLTQARPFLVAVSSQYGLHILVCASYGLTAGFG